MKPIENQPRYDVTELLDRPISPRVLAQRQMRTEPVVVGSIGFEDSAARRVSMANL